MMFAGDDDDDADDDVDYNSDDDEGDDKYSSLMTNFLHVLCPPSHLHLP